jgi:hypothetical protein
MKAKLAVMGLVVAVLVAVTYVATQAAEPEPQMRLLNGLMTEINTWGAVDGLQLSPEQMQALLPTARELRAEQEAIEAERMRSAAEFEAALRGLREELLANNGVSDEAKAAVARAEAGWKQIEYGGDEAVPERVHAILDVLTPEQVQFIAAYRPGAGLEKASPQALARAEQMIEQARRATPEQLNRGVQQFRQRAPQRVPPERMRRAAEGIRAIVTQARALSDAEFQAHRGELAERLARVMAPPRAQGAQHQDLPAKISRVLLNQSLAGVLEAKLGIAPLAPVQKPPTYPEALVNVVTDVRVLNLVNSLYLTPEQMRALSAIIERAYAERQASKPEADALVAQSIALASQVRGELAAGGITPSTQDRLRAAMVQNAERKRQGEARLQQYVSEVKRVLDQNQIVLVSEFIPCLIPIRSLTNPERIGQAQDTAGAERQLTVARRLPQQQVDALIPRAQERSRALLLHKHLPTAEIEARLADLPRVIAEARAMSDTEFEVKKTELAKRIMPPDVPAVAGEALDRRIAEYLLCPNLAAIFAQRMAAQEVASRPVPSGVEG